MCRRKSAKMTTKETVEVLLKRGRTVAAAFYWQSLKNKSTFFYSLKFCLWITEQMQLIVQFPWHFKPSDVDWMLQKRDLVWEKKTNWTLPRVPPQFLCHISCAVFCKAESRVLLRLLCGETRTSDCQLCNIRVLLCFVQLSMYACVTI